MGWEWLFGSGGSDTKTSIPKWMNQDSKAAIQLGQQLAMRPYTPYGFQRIAGFSDDQKDAMGMLRRGAGSVSPTAEPLSRMKKFNPINGPRNLTYNDSLRPGTLGRNDVDSIRYLKLTDKLPGKDGSLEDYMDPYANRVIDRTTKRIREATNYARKWQSDTEANMQGAYGDSRHGVADFLLQREGMQQEGDAAAQGYSDAYNSAMELRDRDIGRYLDVQDRNIGRDTAQMNTGIDRYINQKNVDVDRSLATQQQNLANDLDVAKYNNAGYLDWENLNTQRQLGQQSANSQAQSDFLRYIDSMFRSGAQQQGLDQKNMDLMYQDFQNQRDYPLQQYDLLLRALNGTPSSNNRTVTTGDSGNWMNDLLAGIAGGASIVAQL